MRLLFVAFAVSFCALLWVAFSVARHILRHTQPTSSGGEPDARASVETTLAPFLRKMSMEEIGYKPDSLRAASLPVAWKTVIAVVAGQRPGRNLRPHRPAARLHSCPGHHANFRRAAAGVALHSGSRFRLPGALPDGRRDGPAGLQPSWSGWNGCSCSAPPAATCSLIPLPPRWRAWLSRRGRRSFVAALAGAGLASILILAAGATWLGLLTHVSFCRLRSVGRTFPPRRCHQSPCRDGLRRAC